MIVSEIATAGPTVVTQSGIGLGSILAVTFSWARNRSIFWAILAGIFSWFYVIHFALTRRPEERHPAAQPLPLIPPTPLRRRVEKERDRFAFVKKARSPFPKLPLKRGASDGDSATNPDE